MRLCMEKYKSLEPRILARLRRPRRRLRLRRWNPRRPRPRRRRRPIQDARSSANRQMANMNKGRVLAPPRRLRHP